MFLGWGFYYRIRERKPASISKPAPNIFSGGMLHSLDMQKDENLPMQVGVSVIMWNLFIKRHLWGSFMILILILIFWLLFLLLPCLSNCETFWLVLMITRCLKMLHKLEMESNFQRCKDICQIFTGYCQCSQCAYQFIWNISDYVFANMIRKYGSYVARNPIKVLSSSLAIVLLLCLGLIRFKVETRPEKVCIA